MTDTRLHAIGAVQSGQAPQERMYALYRLDAAAVEAAARSILDKRNPSEKQGEGL